MAPPTSERVRNQIILLHVQRYSTSQISARVGVSRKTVQKYIDRLNETGLVSVRKQTGRPEKLTKVQAEIRDTALRARFLSHQDLIASIIGFPALANSTVTRYLAELLSILPIHRISIQWRT